MKLTYASAVIALCVLAVLWVALPDVWPVWAFAVVADVTALSLVYVLRAGSPGPPVRL